MEGPDNPARAERPPPVPESNSGRNNNRRNNRRTQDNANAPNAQSQPRQPRGDNGQPRQPRGDGQPRPRGDGQSRPRGDNGQPRPRGDNGQRGDRGPGGRRPPRNGDGVPTWSCSPSIPVLETQQYCWTTFHLKCIRSWAAKSVKEVADAWAARGEPQRARRVGVPTSYRCFCDSTPSPAPARISTPHSCASRAPARGPPARIPARSFATPGRAPPAASPPTSSAAAERTVLALRCGETDVSCGSFVDAPSCGAHSCARECHTDVCDPCAEEREVGCGEGDAVPCTRDGADEPWVGRFACDNTCDRLFDCGVHRCAQPAIPLTDPQRSAPARLERCGRVPAAARHQALGRADAFPARANCSAPIPTCKSPWGAFFVWARVRGGVPRGACPPCVERVVRPCRCGGSTKSMLCAVATGEGGEREVLCEKACKALRACGRHQCLRVCCPLASEAAGIGEERGGLHECDLVCGKNLSCGEHRCEQRDHKGPCGPCLRSSFEELICPCGLTVLEPPIPCGTRIQCTYQCPRPPPSCGHPRTQHMCHSDDVGCPPCPFLTTKKCMCGKKDVGNVRCAQERVSCGSVWAAPRMRVPPLRAPLPYRDEGAAPAFQRAASRGSCVYRCTTMHQPCHAPSSCDESAPCTAVITVTCPCGRIRQPVQCGKSVATPAGRENQQPKCSNECLIAKRNARLADALGISQESRERGPAVVWPDEVLAFGRANPKFVSVVEKAFADFVASEKKMQVLPHMPPERRKFVHDVATVYRMDTQMVDQEPHRSVQLLRRFDTKVPSPLLSNALAASGPLPSLGKLADLRTGATASASSGGGSWRAGPPAKPASVAAPGAPRAWGAASAAPVAAAQHAPPVHAPVAAQPAAAAPVRPPAAITTSTPVPLPITPQTPVSVPEDWEDDA
ncbi:hypothetical protein B0H13DRAFT_2251237 [Mycena leptocephala]|nr:hypothetical protein B0H13DRAFT_2251237 [Mycena leptocephala]